MLVAVMNKFELWREYDCVLYYGEEQPFFGLPYELIRVPAHQKPRWRMCAANCANKAIHDAMQRAKK